MFQVLIISSPLVKNSYFLIIYVFYYEVICLLWKTKPFIYPITTQCKYYKHFVYVLRIIFLTEIFTQIIVDSCAVVRNDTERFLVQFVPPLLDAKLYVVLYHNQDIDIDKICPCYVDFPSFTATYLCVHICFSQIIVLVMLFF